MKNTYRFDMEFVKPNTGSLPDGPHANIVIKTCTSSSGEHQLKYITSDCVIFEEMDTQINMLIKELEAIRNKARKKFLQCKPH